MHEIELGAAPSRNGCDGKFARYPVTGTIRPTGTDNVLQVTGDEAMGQLVVTEIEPVENIPAD